MISCTQDPFDVSEDTLQLRSAPIEPPGFSKKVLVKYKNEDRVKVLSVANVQQALEKLAKDQKVEYAEPDMIIELDLVNDSVYQTGKLWNMYSSISTPKNEFGCGAVDLWEQGKTGSADVYVAVIDMGIWLKHPDLINNIGKNFNEIPGNGLDDDGNGFIDDVYGWDFYSNDNDVNDESNHDYFHGTHCAGIIAAGLNNYEGVAGVAPEVKLLSLKAFNGIYGDLSAIINAFYYMVDLKKSGINIVAVNCSWGNTTKTKSLEAAVNAAADVGIIACCSAGNTGRRDVRYPSGYRSKNIISVASINAHGGLSYFSTWNRNIVDLGAPGEDIVSATYRKGSIYYPITWYEVLSGTSMAAPHVAGAVALYSSLHPAAGYLEIKDAILRNVIETPSLANKVKTGGRLDVSRF